MIWLEWGGDQRNQKHRTKRRWVGRVTAPFRINVHLAGQTTIVCTLRVGPSSIPICPLVLLKFPLPERYNHVDDIYNGGVFDGTYMSNRIPHHYRYRRHDYVVLEVGIRAGSTGKLGRCNHVEDGPTRSLHTIVVRPARCTFIRTESIRRPTHLLLVRCV